MSKPASEEAFAANWSRLALDELPEDTSTLATITSIWNGDTVVSGAKPEATAPSQASTLPLPRLSLGAPTAMSIEALTSGDDLSPRSVLGEGGMGRVLLVEQRALGRDVAVKVLKHAGSSKGQEGALIDEARTMGALEHPNVVPVYALARDDAGRPALVMKRIDGVSWKQLLDAPESAAWARLTRDGADRLEANLQVMMRVCDALSFAHRRQVVHRDVKPANVMIGELGEVYLADWGVATHLPSAEAPPPAPRLVGTPAYMAPEMVSGDVADVDARTDVFLLGAVLHELLTGRPPNLAANVRAALERAALAEPHTYGPQAPPELAAICQHAMAADPAGRFPSTEALRSALAQFLSHRGSVALSDEALVRKGELAAALAPEVEPDPARIYSLLSACRFGFTQALRSWPGNTAARTGFDGALAAVARHELDRQNLSAARALLAEMVQREPALEARAAELEKAEAGRSVREKALEKFKYQLDLSVSAHERGRFSTLLAFGTVLVTGVFMLLSTKRYDDNPAWVMLLSPVMVLSVFSVLLVLGRKALLKNKINQRMVGLMVVTMGAVTLNRLQGTYRGLPNTAIVTADLVLVAATVAVAALSVHKSLWSLSLIYVVGALVTFLLPDTSGLVFGLSAAAGFFVLGRLARSGGFPGG